MAQRSWWQSPRLNREEDAGHHRKVTWLELFYDLVFVVVVAEVGHYLAGHASVQGVLGFVLLFVPVWWAWIAGTFYKERFETDGLENRLVTFLQMAGVAAMALFAHDALGKTGAGYALSYAWVRLLHVLLWAWAGQGEAEARPLTRRFVAGYSLSVALFVLSAFVPPALRLWLWGLALLIDLATPVLSLEQQKRLPSLSTSKLPERFGLFVIIVLGESIVGAVQGLAANHHLTWAAGLSGFLGLLLAFGLWWVYFDFVGRRPFKRGLWWGLGWSYLHMPLVMGMTAAGSGILTFVEAEGHGSSAGLLAGAVAVALIAIGLLETTLRPAQNEPTHPLLSPLLKIGGGLAAGAVGLYGGGSPAPLFLVLLFAPVLVQMIYGFSVWYGQDEAVEP